MHGWIFTNHVGHAFIWCSMHNGEACDTHGRRIGMASACASFRSLTFLYGARTILYFTALTIIIARQFIFSSALLDG